MVSLEEAQNPDGGWPFVRGGPSWTEATAYALLAWKGRSAHDERVAAGLRWLERGQQADGGWGPRRGVTESVWVTAAVALLGPRVLGRDRDRRAIGWLIRSSGADTNLASRLRDIPTGRAAGAPGWAWYPGTAAWVMPTAISMLALRQAAARGDAANLRTRLEQGALYLEQHVCADGGWNHGAARVFDVDAPSYPETTGVALLALAGRKSQVVARACDTAEGHLRVCRSAEAESWLRLGLLAQGRSVERNRNRELPIRTVTGAALASIAADAAAGHNAFLEKDG